MSSRFVRRLAATVAGLCLAFAVPETSRAADPSVIPSICTSTGVDYFYPGGYCDSQGVIFPSPRIHVVYWGWYAYGAIPAGQACPGTPGTGTPAAVAAARIGFSNMGGNYGLPGSRWWGITEQYTGIIKTPPTTYGAPTNPSNILVDETCDDINGIPLSGNSYTDNQIIAEAELLWNEGVIKFTGNDVIMVLPPPGFSYNPQGPIPASGDHGYEVYIGPYINISYTNFQQGIAQEVIEHEINETVSDPYGGIGGGNTSVCGHPPFGWVNNTEANCEIGDLCESNTYNVQVQPLTNPPEPNASSTVQQQQLWSDENGGCAYNRTENVFEFGIGQNGQLFVQRVTANTVSPAPTLTNWSQWTSESSYPFVGKPGAASWGPNRLDAFAIDTNNQMWHLYSANGGVSIAEETLSDLTADALPKLGPEQAISYGFDSTQAYTYPDAASVGAGNVQVFAFQRGYGSLTPRLVKDVWDGGTWSEWIPMSTPAPPLSKITSVGFGASGIHSSKSEFPSSTRTVMLSYVDTSNRLWVGYTTDDASPVWSDYTFSGFTPVDVDISAWNPERYDAFVRDTSGRYWDCSSNFPATTAGPPAPSCSDWGAPSEASGALSTFNGTPGAIGLGDGRLFVVGLAQYNPGNGGAYYNSSFAAFWNQNSGTTWTLNNGAFNGPIDLASW